jgi:hypothetical protein
MEHSTAMSQEQSTTTRPYKGVSTIGRSRNGRRFLAKIRQKGVEVHLGLYESSGLAAFAFNVASEAIGRGSRPPNEIPRSEQPDAEAVGTITQRVRTRLGLETASRQLEELAPDPEALLTFFEVTVVGFWRNQASQSDPTTGLDAAARRLAEAARLLFWSTSRGQPSASEVLERLLGRRLDQMFHRADLTRSILDDDGDEDWRVARWLVHPDVYPLARGFVDEVRFLYADHFEGDGQPTTTSGTPHWASVLRVEPPFHLEKIKEAYRARSKAAHPDAGGSHQDFIKLQAAYDEARDYCRIMGV